MNTSEEWPNIINATCQVALLKHMNEWCRDHKDNPDIGEMKKEMKRYLVEQYHEVPREELEWAVAETCATNMIQGMRELANQLIPEDKFFEEGGFSG